MPAPLLPTPALHRRLGVALLVLAPASAGCAASSPAETLAELYAESREDRGVGASPSRLAEIEEDRAERVARARELRGQGLVVTAEDHLYAAAILLDSPAPEDLDAARDLALVAAELGDDRGFPLAAEAIDRGLMQRHLPQKYGTQYVYVPVTRTWELYRWDPATTDAERTAMGVPELAEALRRAKRLNQRD